MSSNSLKVRAVDRIAPAARVAAASLAALLTLSVTAEAYTARVKSACRSDYYRFCPKYGEDSPQLKSCMRSAGANISRKCRDALADGGYIARKYHSSQLGK
ncbi:MAG: hypothetical protein ACT4N2_03285 [Hyphomicrobium sp.]